MQKRFFLTLFAFFLLAGLCPVNAQSNKSQWQQYSEQYTKAHQQVQTEFLKEVQIRSASDSAAACSRKRIMELAVETDNYPSLNKAKNPALNTDNYPSLRNVDKKSGLENLKSSTSTMAVNASDSMALVALYNQCNGPDWTKKANWMTGPVETWEGVTVENGRVVGLNLADWETSVGLTGTLPAGFSNLSELIWLDLSNNQLSGTLPENWSGLLKLESIVLSANQLIGSLPVSWSALVNLHGLWIEANQLTGSLPDSWSAQVNLETMNLSNNLLTGSLPDSWSALVNLQWLGLYSNQLNGNLPVSWSNCVNLQSIHLFNNQLSGSLPGSWSTLANLVELNLSWNQLTGALPDGWSSLANIRNLDLVRNQITGILPESWSSLVNLRSLALGENQLSGLLPGSWTSLINLESLDINSNQLSGTLPDGWSAFDNLQSLYLFNNQLTGTLPASWSSMVNLKSLGLKDNLLSGILPESWSSMVNFEELWLGNNQFTGTLPSGWSALTNLRTLQLYGNLFTGALPESWSALVLLWNLDLGGNQLSGSLPAGWSALLNMQELYLGSNQFTGTLPESWSSLVNLQRLFLDRNQLTGTLPASWSSLVKLRDIFIEINQLTGLPDLSPMTSLNYLLVQDNMLDFGDIEPNIGVPETDFEYSPQAVIGTSFTVYKNTGEEFRVSVTVGGSSNLYAWFKDGNPIDLASGSEYVIPGVVVGDNGNYTCSITNSVATGLTLWSNPITLAVAPPPVNASDSMALVALYNQCNGPNWTRKANWMTGLVETWEGVTVENGRVVGLNLVDWDTSVGLTGTLPAGLSDLTALRWMNLSNNQLSDSLPENLSGLLQLESLVLSANQFTGSLPLSWSALVNLEGLWLDGNQFTGNLPDSWSALVNLRTLHLGNNLLTGSLPDSWSALVNLQWLGLFSNQLTGTIPVSWSAFVNLQSMHLFDNQLSGSLPGSWSALVNLLELILSWNQLTGALPAGWSSLVNIRDLGLVSNHFTGTLPESWSSLVNLRSLALGENQLSGLLPGGWSSLVNLESLVIYDNQISGTLPESWSALVKLQTLYLFNNQLTGSLPASWSSMTNMQSLGLRDNLLTGSLPENWSSMVKMQELGLGNNRFTGSLPGSWSALIDLRTLQLYGNQLTGALPESWSALGFLWHLDLGGNQLSGILPAGWSALSNLQQLYLGSNQLSGNVHTSWTTLVKLQDLYLDNNQFSGLPDLSALTDLNNLTAQNNLLDFGDIEPNTGIPKAEFTYAPQAPVGLPDTIFRNTGEEFRVSVTVGGSSNQYAWFKNGNPIDLASGSEYVIPGVLVGDNGDYTCSVTNTVATELTLWSNPITLIVAPPPCNTSDSLALVALYNQCNGPNWTKKANWLTGKVDTWQGVTVENGRVVGLHLGDNDNPVGLTGTIPSELSNLTEIRSLYLYMNQLSGSLPVSWSALTNLEELHLGSNQLTGALPASWSALVKLRILGLCENQLSGTLPESWSAFVNLQHLNLGGNQLSGSLPASWSALTNLQEIYLYGNQITGTLDDSWSAFTNLRYLHICCNQLTGTLPESWSALVKLEGCNLSNNLLSGPVPDSWSALVSLREVFLNGNQISGLPDFSHLTNLDILHVQYNRLDFGDIEPNIGIPKTEFIYSPQASIGIAALVYKNPGEEFRVSVTVGGISNRYQWYKNGAIISGATGAEYLIPSTVPEDAGAYNCQITNTIATNLTLYSQQVTLTLPTATPFCEDFNAEEWNNGLVHGWSSNGTVGGNEIGFVKGANYGGYSTNGNGYSLIIYPFNNQTVYAMSPGFIITDDSKYLSFYQGKRDYFTWGIAGTTAKSTDPRSVWISTDNRITWNQIYTTTMDQIPEVVVPSALENLQKVDISLAAYEGQTVFFRFQASRVGANRGEWFVEDLCVAELVTGPVICFNGQGNFGFSFFPVERSFLIRNIGSGLLRINSVRIVGDPEFTVRSDYEYPVDIKGSDPGTSEYPLLDRLPLTVRFKPLADKTYSASIRITYGESGDGVLDIPLSGTGSAASCLNAGVAVVGRNFAPSQNTWFKYTAGQDQTVQVTSCDPENTVVPSAYAFDTYLYILSDCDGTVLASNDDLLGACSYNWYSSSVQLDMNAGETIYIAWPLMYPEAPHSDDGFYFSVNVLYQRISKPLSAGWNWFSLNIENTDMSLGQVLGSLTLSEGDYIKNQTVSSTYYAGYGWFGELAQIDPREMYKIKMGEADTMMIQGSPVNLFTRSIYIQSGWNWIGYLPLSAQPVSSALNSINPVENDYIKNQTKSSTFYGGFGWFGELMNLEPLDGYMLKTSHAGTLTYSEGATLKTEDFKTLRQKTEDKKTEDVKIIRR